MEKTLSGNEISDGFLSHGPVADGKALIDRDRAAAWWLPLETIAEAHWPRLAALLTDEERARSERFHFERDRLVYIAAHASCRGMLSYCLGGAPQDWRFTVEEHGKPELVSPSDGPRFRVNISHTRGLAAVALTQEHDIGVDVEWLERTVETEKLAERMFAEPERRMVAEASEDERLDTFLKFWTLKEAYVKAIGKGLSQPLDAFAFDPDALEITFRDELADDPASWHFEHYRPGPKYLMTLAVRHPVKRRLVVDTRPAPLDYLLDLAKG